MYNSQIVTQRIKDLLRIGNHQVMELTDYCGMSKNAISQSSKSEEGFKARNLYNIAEFLSCSVDYLLGRTDNPDLGGISNSVSNSPNAINAQNSTINTSTQLDSMEQEMLDAFRQLPFAQKIKVMSMIAQGGEDHV